MTKTAATYANAAPPPGALFDNAPASRICQDRGGRWVAVDVFMQYGQPVSLDLALRRVTIGRTVFVAREDAERVMEAVTGEHGESAKV